MKKIYRKIGSDLVVVGSSNLLVSVGGSLKAINLYLPSYDGDENLTCIPVEPEFVFKKYLKDYRIDWTRIPECVISIMEFSKKENQNEDEDEGDIR